MTRDHYLLKDTLNRRARIVAENARMAELEQHATPLFILAVFIIFLLVVGLSLSSYVKSQTAAADESNRILADCMNGQTIMVDDAIMHCQIEKHDLVGSAKK